MEGVIWKIEERATEYGTIMYDVVIEFEEVPKITLGKCKVKQ